MKNISFKFAMLSMVLVALVGCSKEQSSFNVEDIPGKAKVMGTLTYMAGQDKEGKAVVRDAANVRVAALVYNEDLKAGSEGFTTYETETNVKGQFTVEVPALDKGVRVKVVADPFFGSYSTLVDLDKGIVAESEVLYKINPIEVQVIPNDIESWDGQFTTSTEDGGDGGEDGEEE